MPYDPALLEAIRIEVGGRPGVTEKRMFGGYCILLRGNMLCGVGDGRYLMRVGKAQEAEALARPGATPMITGKKRMSGFVWVAAEEAEGAALTDWLALCWRYVSALPPK